MNAKYAEIFRIDNLEAKQAPLVQFFWNSAKKSKKKKSIFSDKNAKNKQTKKKKKKKKKTNKPKTKHFTIEIA